MVLNGRVRITARHEIYRRNINAQFLPGGQAAGWMDRMGRQMMLACMREAPGRSGELRRAHRWGRNKNPGGSRYTFTVENVAEYAAWVHDGTITRPPKAVGKKKMRIPASAGHPAVYGAEFRGQRANPWLDQACSRIARRNGAVG